MLTKIRTENLDLLETGDELIFTSSISSSVSDILKLLKIMPRSIYETTDNIFSLSKEPSILSELEIGINIDNTQYTYLLMFVGETKEIISEVIKVNNCIVVSRFIDSPEYFLDEDENILGYDLFSHDHRHLVALFWTKSGKIISDYLSSIIIFDERINNNSEYHSYYSFAIELNNIDIKYKIDSRKLLETELFPNFGFSEFVGITSDGQFKSRTSIGKDITLPYYLVGSGLSRLSRLFPLLWVSKHRNIPIIVKDFCLSFHPLLTRQLLIWYAEENKSQLITTEIPFYSTIEKALADKT